MMISAGNVESRGWNADRWRDIRWLAGLEIREDWRGYIVSAAYLAGLAALIAPRSEIELGVMGLELPFLLMVLILTEPFFSSDYMSFRDDRTTVRLTFLRSMPIPLDVIIGSRMLRLIAGAVLNVPAFFIILYLLGEWEMGIGAYISFALFWTGISALATGYGLCMEVSHSVRRYTLTNVVLLAFLIPLLVYLMLQHDVWPVEWVAGIAENHPILLPVAGLLIGTFGYLGLGVVARNLLAQRELTP